MVRLRHVGPIILLLLLAPKSLAQQPRADPQVTVDVEVTCELVVPASCKGGAGFHIAADGALQTGSQGSTTGRLTSSELSSLQMAARRVLKTPQAGARPCSARPILPGVSETVKVSSGATTLELHGVGGKLDPRCGAPDSPAYDFFRLADKLMRLYLK